MTALTKARDTKARPGDLLSVALAASVIVYQGSLVVLENGNATPGKTATGLKGLGRARETVDNSAGAAGDKSVEVEKGVFLFANDGTDTCTAADIGGQAYAVDDQTVANTDGTATRSAIGEIFDVDSSGVWVKF